MILRSSVIIAILLFCTDTVSSNRNVSLIDENLNEQNVFLPPNLQMITGAIEKLHGLQCKESAVQLLEGVKRKDIWAMQMYDASPKFPVGVLYGSSYSMGNFDECISVGGQYCLADIYIRPPKSEIYYKRGGLNTTLYWAICVPPVCRTNDTRQFLYNVFESVLSANRTLHVNVDDNKCYNKYDTTPYTNLEIAFGTIIIAFVIFITYATVHHWWVRKPNELLKSFSLIQNVRKIITADNKSDLNLNCICGIKFISMGFILSGHALIFVVSGPVLNAGFFKEAQTKLENGFFLNNPLLVDTFLLISGFLMCRLLLLELDKRKGRFNFIVIYIARYIRLTPSYLVVIAFYCTWMIRVNDGPLWNSRIGLERDRCLESWWSNLLYLNNYVNTDHLCMFQSWYLAVDTQLFFVAPFIIYPLWKWKRFGEALLGIATTVSVIIPFAITYRDKLDPTLMMYTNEITDLSTNPYFVNAYIKTHMRANSYFFGLLFGYLVHRLQKSDSKLPSKLIGIGWLVATFCGLTSMFSVSVFYTPGHEYNVLEAALYCSLHRVAWCFSMGWIIIACVTNPSGPVSRFLSWKFFIPISRLTYCAYLVNGLIELHAAGITRVPVYLSVANLNFIVISHVVCTFALAFLVCILFESPIHGLEKILLRREAKQRSAAQNQTEDTNNR